jgi:glycogen(starch) synthase
VTGVTFPAKDPDALAAAVSYLLGDETSARRMAKQARAMVTARYGWGAIAARTAAAYADTIANTPENRAQARAKLASGRPTIVVPEGNLLALDAS